MTTLEKHRHRYESLAALYEERANDAQAAGDTVSADAYRCDAEYFRDQALAIACDIAETDEQPESD